MDTFYEAERGLERLKDLRLAKFKKQLTWVAHIRNAILAFSLPIIHVLVGIHLYGGFKISNPEVGA